MDSFIYYSYSQVPHAGYRNVVPDRRASLQQHFYRGARSHAGNQLRVPGGFHSFTGNAMQQGYKTNQPKKKKENLT